MNSFLYMLRVIHGKLQRNLRQRGLVGTLALAVTALVYYVKRLSPRRRRAARAAQNASLSFDREYGVETARSEPLEALKIRSENWLYGSNYEAIHPQAFRDLMSRVPIHHEEFTFIDFGCGKGRALILAAEFPFNEIIGVEFAADLCRIAERNIAQFRLNPRCRCSRTRVVEADALEFPLPVTPLVVYLYNPFQEAVMRLFVERLWRSLNEYPRQTVVLYDTPRHDDLWAASPLFRILGRDRGYSVYSFQPDGGGHAGVNPTV